jgi:hypothetical protein
MGLDLFHAGFGRLIDFPIEPNTGTFGLLSREAVSALRQLPERHRFFPGLRAWIGFKVADVPYDRQERAAGQPGQTVGRLVRYALDGLFSFSRLPLRVVTYTGLVIAMIGFAAAVFYAVRRLTGVETAPTGYTTLVTLLILFGGLQLIGIGLIGEYLGRIYDEVKQRPLYVLKRPPRGHEAIRPDRPPRAVGPSRARRLWADVFDVHVVRRRGATCSFRWKNFVEGGGLYDGVFSQYGPFFFLESRPAPRGARLLPHPRGVWSPSPTGCGDRLLRPRWYGGGRARPLPRRARSPASSSTSGP